MSSSRRTLISRALRAAAALAAGLTLSSAFAQDGKTVRILVGFPAGGGSDAIARLLADKLRAPLGNSVVVENRAGAGGQIAAQALKTAPADGSVLFLSHDHTISILPLVIKNPGFKPEADFVQVAGIGTFVNAFAVSGATPATGFEGYLDWVRSKGGKGAVGIPAPASTPEFLVKVIGEKYKLDLVSAPYRGSAPMITDMLGNQIPAGVASVQDFIENHRAGKLRVVAVLGTERQQALPDVPTFDEIGLKGFEDLPYYGIYAPKGTPAAEVKRLTDGVAKVLALPEVRTQLVALGLTVEYMTPEQLATREHAYTRAWTRIIQDTGFKPQ